jgi:Tol biopolymer transport system component
VVRTETSARGNGDIVAVRTGGDSTVDVAATGAAELSPALSPDGRWVAYLSNESGGNEIYVKPFPNVDAGKWQVSNGAFASPVWSRDGKELYFIDAGYRLVAAQIGTGAGFTVSELRPLFDVSRFVPEIYHPTFDVTKDGRFIFAGARSSATARSSRLVEVDNWFADVRARAAP